MSSLQTTAAKRSTFDDGHHALDRILGDVSFLTERRSFFTAAKRFGEFRRALERHIIDEEEIFFPHYLAQTNDPHGILPTLLEQHVALRASAERAATALSQSDDHCARSELEGLDLALQHHCETERRTVYRALAAVLPTDADVASLITKVRHGRAPGTRQRTPQGP